MRLLREADFRGVELQVERARRQTRRIVVPGLILFLTSFFVIFAVFNLAGLPTYPSAYDKFLIVVGLVFNALTVWYAWQWG